MFSKVKLAIAVTAACGAVVAGAGIAAADDGPVGVASNSPGLISGNVIQVPLHVPINVCGDTIDLVGLLNPSSGNTCTNS
ncbi:chaplin [Streptomyces sp. SDr-06]|uniref:chaplin n=1 Tax=Streptomyces sp. SDr-06 TaxID=2267702 RepID=UPI001CB88C54|nr:chaplin [Streptomyces sp. SDr-06]